MLTFSRIEKFEYDGDLNPSFVPGPVSLPIESIKAVSAMETDTKGNCPKFIYVSSAGVTRPDRPGIDVTKEPPAVGMNDALGGILTYKLKVSPRLSPHRPP